MAGTVQYVELDRGFRELDPTVEKDEAALQSYTLRIFGMDDRLDWDSLLKRDRVVVLGEAGSGKTREFRHRSELLANEGQFSFFVPLDRLIVEPLHAILGTEARSQFERWRKSSLPAFFFLDSVDEAKLRKHSDFSVAIQRVADALGINGLGRGRIFLSSRLSAWQPGSDAAEFNARLPAVPSPEPFRPGDTMRSKKPERQPALIVVLDPLDRVRVERFARGAGIPDAERFLEALDTADAWEFARRPVDVLALVEFWGANRRLGSLTEIIKHNVQVTTRETAARSVGDPLSEKRARDGVETLGSATVLCRRLNIKIPDDAYVAADALDAQACLPADWRPEETQALLARALFDSAIYGRIRFHDRRVAEYLAARWLESRMREGCPVEEVRRLLFVGPENAQRIKPSLAAVAAWLCVGDDPWRQQLQTWILTSAPATHLQFGDPGSLALEYRREILKALVAHHRGGQRAWIEYSSDGLLRLADPQLAPEVSAIIQDATLPADFRIAMLRLVQHARLVGCADAVFSVIASGETDDSLKYEAVRASQSIGTAEQRKRLAGIACGLPRLGNLLCAALVEFLYPENITAKQVTDLLRKSRPEGTQDIGPSWHLKEHLQEVLTEREASDLLAELLHLMDGCGDSEEEHGQTLVMQPYAWLCEVVPMVLRLVLRKPTLSTQECADAVLALGKLCCWNGQGRLHNENLTDMDDLTAKHASVRGAYFWRRVAERRKAGSAEGNGWLQRAVCSDVIRPGLADIEWLAQEVQGDNSQQGRESALRAAMQLWRQGGCPLGKLKRLGAAAGSHGRLKRLFWRLLLEAIGGEVKWRWYRRVGITIGSKFWWVRRTRQLSEWSRRMRERAGLLARIRGLRNGRYPTLLGKLVMEAYGRHGGGHLAPDSWQPLVEKRGDRIARAAKQGCKVAWRDFTPPLPHEKKRPNFIDARVVVGLAGLRVAIEENDLDFAHMSEEEAMLVARYAVNELNGFPAWFPDLAKHRPDAVRAVLVGCVRGEWCFDKDQQRVHEVMYRLVWHDESLGALVRDALMELLRAGDPANALIHQCALTLVLRNPQGERDALASVAAGRVRAATAGDPAWLLWMAVWLQIDAVGAQAELEKALVSRSEAGQIMVHLCAMLSGKQMERGPILPDAAYQSTANLRRFIPLVFDYVKPADDIRHGATYTPGDRDHAQQFRDGLVQKLAAGDDPGTIAALRGMLSEPSMIQHRMWIEHLLNERISKEANGIPWTPQDIRTFAKDHEIDPKTTSDLFRISSKRLNEIKRDVERSDNSLREEIRLDAKESALRRWLARKLRERSRGRYTVPQEAEIDQGERPDIRVEHPKTDPVSIEVKWADNWTLVQLLDALEKQLVGQYLRAHNSRFGLYLLGMIGRKKHWEQTGGPPLNFSELCAVLSKRADEMVASDPHIEGLAVLGVDFREPKGRIEAEPDV